MEPTIQMTATNFLSKAMTMPAPPPMPQLARKRSWTEMTHARPTNANANATLHTTVSPPPAASLYSKKTKRTLSGTGFPFPGMDDGLRCRGCEARIDGESIGAPSIASLSADALQFLAEDPFDFDALPHPVLKRQQAVQNVRDHMYGMASMADDDMIGEALSLAPLAAHKPLPPRWNASVVGTSLAHMGRVKSGVFQPRRM